MKTDKFNEICSGKSVRGTVFISHPSSNEQGKVTACIPETQHLMVETPDHERRCWDAGECEVLPSSESDPTLK